MLPLESVLEYEPGLRVRIKAALRQAVAKRSSLWRLKESVGGLAASLEQVAGDMEAVSEQLRAAADNTLSEDTLGSVDWLDTIALCFRHAGGSLTTLVVEHLEQNIADMQRNIQDKKEEQQQAEKVLCTALSKFARIPESKASERACFVENTSVYEARKAWHARTLGYCAELNAFSVKQRTLVHPSLANVLRILQQLTSRALSPARLEGTLRDIESDHSATVAASSDLKEKQHDTIQQLISSSEPHYYIETDPDNPFQEEARAVPKPQDHRVGLRQYLMHKMRRRALNGPRPRRRRPSVISQPQWALVFCCLTDTMLIIRNEDDIQVDALPLHRCHCLLGDADDRRHVFAVKSRYCKGRLLFQAPNSETRHRWVRALNELGKHAPPPPSPDTASGDKRHQQLQQHKHKQPQQSFTVRYTNLSSTDPRHDADSEEESDPDEAHWDLESGLQLRSSKERQQQHQQSERSSPRQQQQHSQQDDAHADEESDTQPSSQLLPQRLPPPPPPPPPPPSSSHPFAHETSSQESEQSQTPAMRPSSSSKDGCPRPSRQNPFAS